jgi:hypothetical protein
MIVRRIRYEWLMLFFSGPSVLRVTRLRRTGYIFGPRITIVLL